MIERIIQALKEKSITFSLLRGEKLETYIQFVYQMLLNVRDEDMTTIKHNHILTGNSGAQHQIDVYYEFKKLHITHKVAIECKGNKSPVKKSDIQDFYGKLHDLGL